MAPASALAEVPLFPGTVEGKRKQPARPLDVEKKRKSSVLWHALSGTVGSLLAECVLFPVDTIKLHVQTAAADDSRGFLATLAHVIGERGIAGLYGGLGGSMIKEFVHSLNFWLFHGFLFKYVAKFDDTSKTPTWSRLLLNMLAKQLNWLCTVPFEAVSSMNQLAEGNPGFFVTGAALYREGGIGAFYRGLPVSLVLAINPAIMNTLVTSLLRIFTAVRQARGDDYLDSRDHGAAAVGMATGIAKAVATVLTYPLIRSKVLQQTSGKTVSLVAVLKNVVATEGVTGLYRGVLAMSYKTVLWNALMMAVKHLLAPKQVVAISPPGTPVPKAAYAGLRVPLLAREPFPVELVTMDKLNEIASYLKMEYANADSQRNRIDKLENGLTEVTQEIREVKFLLMDLVAASKKQNAP